MMIIRARVQVFLFFFQKKIRGASGTITQIMSAIGMMIMFSVGPYASYLAVNIIMTSLVLVTYIPILFIPESPYYLYAKG